jgi:hypothetical protein
MRLLAHNPVAKWYAFGRGRGVFSRGACGRGSSLGCWVSLHRKTMKGFQVDYESETFSLLGYFQNRSNLRKPEPVIDTYKTTVK